MARNFAATRLVNPPGIEPKLSLEQLWAGIRKKAREPKGFVPSVVSCSVVEDSANKVVREVVFRNEGNAGETKLTEHITFYEPVCAIFCSEGKEKLYITNLISFDKENNLQLTFSFLGGYPGGEDPGPSVSLEEMSQKVGLVVEKTIEVVRDLIREGVL